MTETLEPGRESVLDFEFWEFEFVYVPAKAGSDLELRISDFGFSTL